MKKDEKLSPAAEMIFSYSAITMIVALSGKKSESYPLKYFPTADQPPPRFANVYTTSQRYHKDKDENKLFQHYEAISECILEVIGNKKKVGYISNSRRYISMMPALVAKINTVVKKEPCHLKPSTGVKELAKFIGEALPFIDQHIEMRIDAVSGQGNMFFKNNLTFDDLENTMSELSGSGCDIIFLDGLDTFAVGDKAKDDYLFVGIDMMAKKLGVTIVCV